MPLAALGLGTLCFPDAPLFTTGLVLEYSVPTAVAALMWVGISRGNGTLCLSVVMLDTLLYPVVIQLCIRDSRRHLEPIQDALLEITSRFYAVVDYPDEDIQDIRPQEIAAALRDAAARLERLLATCRRGRVLKSGVRTAIVGRPNAGKSSLLNALAGYERAIVTDVPVSYTHLPGSIRRRCRPPEP